MGNNTSNTTKIQQDVSNNFFSSNTNDCYASASSTITGTNTVITSTGKVKGDINTNTIQGTISASCSLVQQTNQSVTNILKAQAGQTASTVNDLFNDGVLFSQDKNSVDMSQSITNNITSINSNTCNAIASADISYTNVVIAVNDVGGSINTNSINTDVNGTCSITNTTSQEAKNTSDASAEQDSQNMGMFSAFFMMIVSLCVLAIVCLFLFFGGGALIYGMSGKKKETPPAQAPPADEYAEEGY